MSRIILAFLACVSSVAGQDAVLLSDQTGTLWGNSFTGLPPKVATDVGIGLPQWQVQSASQDDDLPFRRGYVRFTVPDSPMIARATLQVPAGFGDMESVAANDPAIVLFHDIAVLDLPTAFFWDHKSEDSRKLWTDSASGEFFGSVDLSLNVIEEWSRNGAYFSLYSDKFYSVNLSPLAVRSLNDSRGGLWATGSNFTNEETSSGFIRVGARYPEYFNPPAECGNECHFQLELTYGPPPPLGDFNASGTVEQSDLDFVLLNWGVTDQEELDAVLMTWGQGGLAAASVPEPSGILLACVIMAAGILSWSRRR